MPSVISEYKDLIYRELDNIPKESYPALYRLIKKFSTIFNSKKKKSKNQSLRGLWGNLEISDELITEAKNSIFNFREF
jgi:hypothetical protein